MHNHEIHASHTCFACGHTMGWAGDIYGGIVVAHGNEVGADVSVIGSDPTYVHMAIQLQCPECGAVNQFKGRHPKQA
ncbi:hypothetical protein [Alicyclobacillus acidiphilus]|uniref:hypothetical protein n=1 Tax=Alicyclobacillus acidiphilus TaxID=182455 RepID=UPI000AE8B094|nr:hypothetical protein [Alicyclobacillus acidiphilus]